MANKGAKPILYYLFITCVWVCALVVFQIWIGALVAL